MPAESPASGPQPVRRTSPSREPIGDGEVKVYDKVGKRLAPEEQGQVLALPTRQGRGEFVRKWGMLP